jgi:hypothetical protein
MGALGWGWEWGGGESAILCIDAAGRTEMKVTDKRNSYCDASALGDLGL